MKRAPPIATLFPYTTLFRSVAAGGAHRSRAAAGRPRGSLARQPGKEPVFCARHRFRRCRRAGRSEEHTSELQSQSNLVCRLLLEKKKAGGGGAERACFRAEE